MRGKDTKFTTTKNNI